MGNEHSSSSMRPLHPYQLKPEDPHYLSPRTIATTDSGSSAPCSRSSKQTGLRDARRRGDNDDEGRINIDEERAGGGQPHKLSYTSSDSGSDKLAVAGGQQTRRKGSIALPPSAVASACPFQPLPRSPLKSQPPAPHPQSHDTHRQRQQRQSIGAGKGYGMDGEENRRGEGGDIHIADDARQLPPLSLESPHLLSYPTLAAKVTRKGTLGKAQSQLQLRLNTPPGPTSILSKAGTAATGGNSASAFADLPTSNHPSSGPKHLIAGSKTPVPVNVSVSVSAKCPPRRRRMSMVEEWAMNNRLREGLHIGDGTGTTEEPATPTSTDTSPSSSRRPSRTPAPTPVDISSASNREILSNYRRFSRGSCLPGTVPAGEMSGSSSSLTVELSGPTLAEHLRLSAYQVIALQQSWARMKSTNFQQIFKQLAQKNTAAKELFQKMSILEGFSSSSAHHQHQASTTISSSSLSSNAGMVRSCCDQREHLRLLTDLLETSIQEVGSSPFRRVQSNCFRVGEAHSMALGANYNAGSRLWDDLGDCLTDVATKTEPIRGKREAFRAWISLISFLIDSMKAGYTTQYKRSSTRSSNGQLTAADHRFSSAPNTDGLSQRK